MFHAITLGDLDLIKLLIRHGVDARHKDQFGFTPIDYTKSILAQIKLFSNEGAEQLKKLGFNAAQIQALRNNSKTPKLSATECDVIIKLLESSKQ